MKSTALMMTVLTLCAGCTTAPSAPPTVVESCPRLPEMEELPAALLEPSSFERMRNFLQGKLPAPTSYELRSSPATQATGLRATP